MEFRNLKKQYCELKEEIDRALENVLLQANYISGQSVRNLEKQLADYVDINYCITCANGTDALQLALMCWNIGPGDAVFVPDFTFFSTAEVVAICGATPIFVDVNKDTFNMETKSLEEAIVNVRLKSNLIPKAIIPVDLFGQVADFPQIRRIAEEYNLYVLEDGAQGFGGRIGRQKACSFGDISTTSFFPAKPLGCYGDGGAIFTDNIIWADKIRSLCVHGKGKCKYDNIRIGMNSRLDTIQAEVLLVKLRAFKEYELDNVNRIADMYSTGLKGILKLPTVKDNYYSSWAQYVVQFNDEKQRDEVQKRLKEENIPSMIYYPKPLHEQIVFKDNEQFTSLQTASILSKTVLALPMSPYLDEEECNTIIYMLRKIVN